MKKQTVLITALAALFIVTLGVNSGFAQKTDGQEKGANKQSEQSSGSMSMSGHEGIETGRDFGEHVSGHDGKFSGDHNPGNHKGFSTVKD